MSLLRSRFLRFAALLIAAGVLATACGSEVDAVSLGETTLSRAELDDLLDGRFPDTAAGNHPLEGVAVVLSDLVFFEALAAELEVEPSDQDITEAAGRLETEGTGFDGSPYVADTPWGDQQERADAIRTGALAWIDDEVAGVDVGTPEALCASHILVASEEEAVVVVARLDAGEDFAAVAATSTIDPSGTANGGDLGCVPTAAFDQDFVAGARGVAPAGRTGPVQTQFGFHIIDLRSFGPSTTDVHPELDAGGIAQVQGQALTVAQQLRGNELITEVQEAALDRIGTDLELDGRYGAWDPVAAAVAPPDGVVDSTTPLVPGGLGGG